MIVENIVIDKEWGISERIPGAFVSWINYYVNEKLKTRKLFIAIASDWEVNPSYLSRWMAGMGPLTEKDIRSLSNYLGPGTYTVLGIPRFRNDNT